MDKKLAKKGFHVAPTRQGPLLSFDPEALLSLLRWIAPLKVKKMETPDVFVSSEALIGIIMAIIGNA